VVLGLTGLAGCGAVAAGPAIAPPPSASASAAGILAQTVAALDRVHSFHLQGTEQLGGLPVSLSGDFSIPGRVAVTITEAGRTFSLRSVGGRAYIMANAQYWVGLGAAASAVPVLANRWVREPEASDRALAPFLALARRQTLGRCAVEPGGTVTLGPSATIDGEPALVLIDHGDAPGSSPGRLYVGAGSLPVRVTESGPAQPGGTPDRTCGETGAASSANTSSSFSFSRYDLPVRITAPPHALSLGELGVALRTVAPKPRTLSAGARSARSIQKAELVGDWRASGLVVQDGAGVGNERPGAVLDRIWRITRLCGGGRCRLFMTRTTVSVPISAPLTWTGGHWTADFVEDDPCSNGGTAVQYSQWTIDVRPQTIAAIERSRTVSCGAAVTSLLRWSAHPVLPPAGSSSRT
jgi:hypothetical protein